jgi:hypothetical protein
MVIRDSYQLKRSDPFFLAPRQSKTIDLSLKKASREPCTLLIGVVSGCEGPVEAATVMVFDKSYQPIAYRVTDEKGCFLFENTLIPDEYIIIATAEGFQVSEACNVFLCSGVPFSVSIWLQKTDPALKNGVYGNVFDEANARLDNVAILISEDEAMERCVAFARTNAQGEYFIYGLDTGIYWICTYKEGYFLPQKLSFEIQTKEYACVNLFLYALPDSVGGSVCGMVDSCGQALPDAVAALFRSENNGEFLLQIQKTNRNGCYLFPDVRPGHYIVRSKKESVSGTDRDGTIT